ncbi:organic hydroperoxide resistance protein [Agromyces atrinae]|uniref:Ohr subfamily peroxiredoxin n=1 Tax=Agromyces atrinae TaxID=592376 RepID=A0A4Q2M915_9MICO|nr:organic hydroperoxide resistance protein [Agromyces atrinae]NYD67951.1 Ohr subfamily peroxiredoxin [Agromyces atrinae]RXZ87887.1 organic hydroperoxide resistance protein [Agromyces atrinae]
MTILYTAEALSTGGGRDGHVSTTSGRVDLDMTPPKELGGAGTGSNPEELFAAGYAACFHSALQAAARAKKVAIANTSVGSQVHIGPNGEGGFVLSVDLEVVIPELDPETAQQLADDAHQLCPYSNATRGNIVVNVTVSDD